jgi:hypothetical protein
MSGHSYAASLLTLMLVMAAEPMPVVHASSSAREHEAAADPCLLQLRTAVSRVTLQLVDRVRLPADARTEMMRETIELWRAAGVDVEWSKLPPAGTVDVVMTDAAHPRIQVIVTKDMPDILPSAPSKVRVMASILFVENRPTTLIGAYPEEVERLLDTMHMDSGPISERPAVLRQRLMGRVLGRAIAHELGHYLFGSRDHAPIGLMRARHRVDDLTSPFRRAFRVIPADSSAVGCSATRGSW